MGPLKLKGTGGRKHVIGMAVDLHIAPYPGDPAVGADQNRGAKDALGRSCHTWIFRPRRRRPPASHAASSETRGTESWCLSRKASCAFSGSAETPSYRGLTFRKGVGQPCEVDGLLGAARGVRARIEKQHELFHPNSRPARRFRRHRAAGGRRAPLRPRPRPNLRPADASGFAPDGLLAAGLFALGLAAAAFDSAAARKVDSPARGDFDFFDGALSGVRAAALPDCLSALLPDFFAVAFRVFSGVLPEIFAWTRVVLPEEGLEDFLRVFLDIRLPFVAFGGSIMGYCGPCPGEPESGRLLGKSDGLGVWLQGIRRTTRPLVECALGPDDE